MILNRSCLPGLFLFGAAVIVMLAPLAQAQLTQASPSRDIDQVTDEAQREPEAPVTTFDRPIYRALQEIKKELNTKYGINFAIENTTIYQAASGGVEPNDALVNTLGLFITWKIFRAENGKDFGGVGFQFETRANPLGEFPELRDSLGTLWSPNDSTSDDYTRINQLWWGQRFGEGRYGFIIGKIDPGSRINGNRFAGSGNTQFFGQPFATNPARSFPQNGLGVMLRAEPTDWLDLHFTMCDSDANANYSPFKTINGNWLYVGEITLKPKFEGLGQGMYRLMLYQRDTEAADEFGWSVSIDQNITDDYGVFLRYGNNDGGLNSINHIVAAGFSFLRPFDRPNDQAGVGVSFTHPHNDDFRDQYSTEIYYRLQVTEGFELSADAQVIFDPATNDRDVEAVFGVRARLLY